MARLQILELPEGSGDDRPPFVLVIDQVPTDEAGFDAIRRDLGTPEDLIERLGARAVLVFEDTIDIPGNDVPLDPDGYPLKFRIEPDFETFREQVQEEVLHAQGKVTRALNTTDWKRELQQALGMDRTRDWDDIRNAAARLRQERDEKGAALERVRALDDEPAAANMQKSDPNSFLHGYRVAISAARLATWPTRDGEAKE